MLMLKAVLFLIAVPGSLIVLVPWLILHGGSEADIDPPTLRFAGVPMLAAGTAMVLWCAWDFLTVGRGTPAPMAPPRALVSSGLYRVTRNPMYVGVIAAQSGEALLFWSPPLLGHALGTWLCIQAFVILYEEPSLERRFGQAYRDYRQRVPRWLGWRWRSRRYADR